MDAVYHSTLKSNTDLIKATAQQDILRAHGRGCSSYYLHVLSTKSGKEEEKEEERRQRMREEGRNDGNQDSRREQG